LQINAQRRKKATAEIHAITFLAAQTTLSAISCPLYDASVKIKEF